MFNSKEYSEILEIFKLLIDRGEIQVTQEMFSLNEIKTIILTNSNFINEVNSLKEKIKAQTEKNKNLFSLILQLNKKKSKEIKLVLNNLKSDFSLFYNEPTYIENLNKEIYQRIIEDINSKSQSCPLIAIINGNFSEELFRVKSAFYKSDFAHFNSQIILDKIYNAKNTNLSTGIFTVHSRFKFKLHAYSMQYLKGMFNQIITNLFINTEEQLNAKKKRETIMKLVHENKPIQLLELCKGGIPPSLRKNVYLTMMNVDRNQNYCSDINHNDTIFLVDYYNLFDVHLAASSENYFLFEENLIKLLCLILRDKDLLHQIQGLRPVVITKEKNKSTLTPYPTSGLFPFQGLAFQLACFTYMSNQIEDYYQVAKWFFAKYLSFLTSFTTNKNSILSLVYSFHHLFNQLDAFYDLRMHFNDISFDINLEVFNWFITSFGMIFTPEYVYLIYDIVIISDSLQIYILVALALLHYRRKALLSLVTSEDIKKSLHDISYDLLDCIELLYSFMSNVS